VSTALSESNDRERPCTIRRQRLRRGADKTIAGIAGKSTAPLAGAAVIATMFCEHCGARTGGTARFCSECGSAVELETDLHEQPGKLRSPARWTGSAIRAAALAPPGSVAASGSSGPRGASLPVGGDRSASDHTMTGEFVDVDRVCPDCGMSPRGEPVCPGCGLNLRTMALLPTREEWERGNVVAGDENAQAIAGCLRAIDPISPGLFDTPVDARSFDSPSTAEAIERAVRKAIEDSVAPSRRSSGFSVSVQRTVITARVMRLSARIVSGPDRTVVQDFECGIDPNKPRAKITRSGAPRLVDAHSGELGVIGPQRPRRLQQAANGSSQPRNRPTTADPHYTLLTIREVFAGRAKAEDGLLFPVPLDQTDMIAVESRDGRKIKSADCVAIALRVNGARRPIAVLRDIRAQLMLTDARLTIACSKFDKGGGWWGMGGGALLAIPLNVGSHALAAHRRRGKMLVGQVRYPWLHSVYAQNRVGWGGAEVLRVFANAGGNGLFQLDLTFPKDVDATAIATELIRRAAAFRLEHDEDVGSPEDHRRLQELSTAARLVDVKGSGQMTGHTLPKAWPASVHSARFGLTPAGRLS
jgi:hypothetical protein